MKENIKNSIWCRIVIISLMLFVRCSPGEISLLDLQKKMLAAQTELERQQILDRLDSYYLRMVIPDSIRQQAEVEVDTLIKWQQANEPELVSSPPDTNVYCLENQLKNLLRDAMVARVRSDESDFRAIMQYARNIAVTIESKTGSNYWHSQEAKIESLNVDHAKAWLLADRAERRCKAAHPAAYVEAEQYGALGLQLLQQVPDDRLCLDIVQRLLIILTESRGMYDLGYPLAQRTLLSADELKYQLRAAGICYNYANALYLAGQNQLALSFFQESIERAEKYCYVPQIFWYKKNGLLGTAKANWQLGNYEQALLLCNEVEKFELADRENINLHNTLGMIHRNLGNFDKAEAEYKQALSFAIKASDVYNQIYILQNLGTLYHRMTDFDLAIDYYNQAMKLTELYPQNDEIKIGLLLCLVETKAEQNDIRQFNETINNVNHLIEHINLPSLKAELLRSTGRLNMKVQKYEQAYHNFKPAIELYEKYKLRRAALETKNDLAESLIGLEKFQEAKDLLNEVYNEATTIQDAQHRIDAIGMLAIIAQKEGDLDRAIKTSNQFLKEFDSLRMRFNGIDNLIRFRQKIHDYLKNAVSYEIAKGRIDSAFVKLDYIKSRISNDRLEMNEHESSHDYHPHYINIDRLQSTLKPGHLVINYFVTNDSLYAFVLNNENLVLLKKEIANDKIENLVAEYLISINKSIDIFQNNQQTDFVTHYDTVAARGQRLYRALLDWEELQLKLENSEITYIIPDDMLHGIPFSCLMNPDNENHQFLAEQTAIVSLPSASSLQLTQQDHNDFPLKTKRVLISADREFPGAEALVTSIKKQFLSAEELTIDKPVISNVDVLSKLREPYRIYFFIAHSQANTRMPNLSLIKLVATQKADSIQARVVLNLTDFKTIDWSLADMVFLIGCETAAGKLFKGSGFDSFQQCFLFRGAKCVLASRWRIDAQETIDQITQFLKSWESQSNPALALQQIEINAIHRLQQDPYFKRPHPFLWGSFALYQAKN